MQPLWQVNVFVAISLLLLLLPPQPVQALYQFGDCRQSTLTKVATDVSMPERDVAFSPYIVLPAQPVYFESHALAVPEFSRRLTQFSMNMYSTFNWLKPNQNVVFAPFSIQSIAAMARLGAEGETATELDRGLGLMSSDPQVIARSFHRVLTKYVDSNLVHIANRIYVMEGYELHEEFNSLIREQFHSSAISINFAQNIGAADNINSWVESQTNNTIKNLVSPDSFDTLTRLVLINAIYFKGDWEHQFLEKWTHKARFYSSETDNSYVSMMFVEEHFRYADLTSLDATVLELPYKDSDLVMLILLPKSRTGLAQLEQKLVTTSLSAITENLKMEYVNVNLPKFKAEFELELTKAFQTLGMSRLFTAHAEFGNMLQSDGHLQVSKIVHKAFIEVNEKGTEAAAASALVDSIRSRTVETKFFTADHPFFYYIVNKQDEVLFTGRLLKI